MLGVIDLGPEVEHCMVPRPNVKTATLTRKCQTGLKNCPWTRALAYLTIRLDDLTYNDFTFNNFTSNDFTYNDFTFNDFTYSEFTYKDFNYNDLTYNDFTYNGLYLYWTLLIMTILKD